MQYHEEEERYAIDQIDRAASLSRELAESEPALIAWPETVVGAPLNPGAAGMLGARQSRQRRHALETLRALTGELDCYFLIGSTFLAENDSGGGSANSAYLFSPEGEIIGRYDKIFLVPFGEYTPGKNLLPAPVAELLASFAIAQSEAGEVPVVFSRPARFAASICYDNVFSSLMRRFRRDGADVIVNISNEGWYHIRGELEQHLAIAVFRAVETRTSIVRATNTGISCFIDPAGRIYGMVTGEKEGVRTAMNVKGSLAAPVLLTDHVPIYSRTGDWFAVLCAALTAVYAVCAIARCRRRPNVPENK